MSRNKIKFNSRAFKRVIQSPGVKRMIHDTGYRMRAHAGTDVVKVTEKAGRGDGRPIAIVSTKAKTPKEAETAREALESAAHLAN